MNTKILKISFEDIHANLLAVFLTASVLVLGITYIYLVSTSLFLANAKNDAQDSISQIESQLALLETDYISAQSAIDMPYALALGYVEAPKDSTFAYRTQTNNPETSLSLSR